MNSLACVFSVAQRKLSSSIFNVFIKAVYPEMGFFWVFSLQDGQKQNLNKAVLSGSLARPLLK